jgi:hypothetical protein
MTEPLWVDPAALSGAGASVAGVGDGLGAALNSLTASFNADTGQDAAGMAFGFAYRRSGKEIVAAVAAGVKAARHTGYLVQGSATNYSRAEAAADISGRSAPLPAPASPADYASPVGEPDVNGAGTTPPALWYLVEALVGDVWPNGDPDAIRTAAGAWRTAATPLYQVTGDMAGAYATISGQQIPDREPMKAAVRDIGTAMSGIAGSCQTLANELDQFGRDVESTQNAIRDLLEKLKSLVKSVANNGILGTIIELFDGDDEQEFDEVVNDIKAVIANHKRQSEAREEFIQGLIHQMEIFSRGMEIVVRKELVNYLGEDAGRVVANVYDAVTDAGVGMTKEGIVAVDSAAGAVGNPAAALDTIKGLGKLAFTFNAATAPIAFAMDPEGSVDLFKSVTHWDDTVTSNRPFIGVGESLFDVGSMLIPGGAGGKAVSEGSRVAGEASEVGQVGRVGERAAIEGADLGRASQTLGNLERSAEGITGKLDEIARKPVDVPTAQPQSAPGRPISPAEPGPGRPGEPSSAPADAPVPPGPTESRPPTSPAPEPAPVGASPQVPHATPPVEAPAASPHGAGADGAPRGPGVPKLPELASPVPPHGTGGGALPRLPEFGGDSASAERLMPRSGEGGGAGSLEGARPESGPSGHEGSASRHAPSDELAAGEPRSERMQHPPRDVGDYPMSDSANTPGPPRNADRPPHDTPADPADPAHDHSTQDADDQGGILNGENGVAGSIRSVNPGGGDMNCVNCVITTDQMLDGVKVSAALDGPKPISFLESYFGSHFTATGGKLDIEATMSAAGDGARGVIFASRGPGQVGHVFNVVNQNGVIRFLDGQPGAPASFAGYRDFYLMRYR